VTAWGIIVAAVIAVAGWFVAAWRERRNDRRDYWQICDVIFVKSLGLIR
jgi:hypothetical protein